MEQLLVVCVKDFSFQKKRIWYERVEGGCFDYAACLSRRERESDCRRKYLTDDPEVALFVQGLRNSFSEESGGVVVAHRSV